VVARNAGRRPIHGAAAGFIDHVCYTISNWDEARVTAGLKETVSHTCNGPKRDVSIRSTIRCSSPTAKKKSVK